MAASRLLDDMHWAAKYIGLPFQPGGTGPDRVDCWGLLCLAYRERHGILLPDLANLTLFQQHQITEASWLPVERPQDGDAVAMGKGRVFSHVGLWVTAGRGLVMHCFNSQAVVAESLADVRQRGYRNIRFYRHQSWPA